MYIWNCLVKTAKALNHNEFYSNSRPVCISILFLFYANFLKLQGLYEGFMTVTHKSTEKIQIVLMSMHCAIFNSYLVLSSMNIKMGR